MSPVHQLNDLQLDVLRVLWRAGEATAAEVHETLQSGRAPAPTTVATVLHRLEKKGLVSHRTEGRQFIFRARVSEQEVRRSIVAEVTERLFHGDVAAVVNQLLNHREISREDLERVKALVTEREGNGGMEGAGGNGTETREPKGGNHHGA